MFLYRRDVAFESSWQVISWPTNSIYLILGTLNLIPWSRRFSIVPVSTNETINHLQEKRYPKENCCRDFSRSIMSSENLNQHHGLFGHCLFSFLDSMFSLPYNSLCRSMLQDFYRIPAWVLSPLLCPQITHRDSIGYNAAGKFLGLTLSYINL